MRRVRGAYNASTFDAYVKAARAAEAAGTPVPRWNPPAIPLWKGVFHLHRFVQDRMSSAAFGAAIRRGWDDTGILPAEDGKPRPVQYSALMRPKVVRRSVAAHQLSSALGGDVFAVKESSNKSVTALQILAPMQIETRGNAVSLACLWSHDRTFLCVKLIPSVGDVSQCHGVS